MIDREDAGGLEPHSLGRSSALVTSIKDGGKNAVGDAVFRLVNSAENQKIRMFVRDMAVFEGRGEVAAKQITRNRLTFKILLTGDKLDPDAPRRIRGVSDGLKSIGELENSNGWYDKPLKFLPRKQNIRYVIVGDRVICVTGPKGGTSALLIRSQEIADWFTTIFETDWESLDASEVALG